MDRISGGCRTASAAGGTEQRVRPGTYIRSWPHTNTPSLASPPFSCSGFTQFSAVPAAENARPGQRSQLDRPQEVAPRGSVGAIFCLWAESFMISSWRRYCWPSTCRRRNSSGAHAGIGLLPSCQSRTVRGVRLRMRASCSMGSPRLCCSNSIGCAQRLVLFFMSSKKTPVCDWRSVSLHPRCWGLADA